MKLSPIQRNAVANYANFATVAIVGVIVNPLLVGALGTAWFGIWKSCQKAIDFASVADGRASQALKWVIAFRSGEPDQDKLKHSVGASLVVWLVLLPVISTVSAVIAFVLPAMLTGVPAGGGPKVSLVAAVLGLNIVLSGLLGIPDSVLVGTNQGYRSTTIATLSLIGLNVAMVVAAQRGNGAVTLGVLTVAGAAVTAALTLFVARRHVPWFGISRPSRVELRSVGQFSGWIMAASFITKILFATELLLFGSLIGVTAAAHFSFTNFVLNFGLSACLLTVNPFMPQLGRALGRRDTKEAQRLVRDSRELSLALAVICAGMVLAVNGTFVGTWIGSDFYLGDEVNALMTMAFLQLALIRTDDQIQDTGLAIRSKVLVGLAGAAGSAGLALAAYQLSESVPLMYVGLIAGRLITSLTYPRFVSDLVPGTTTVNRNLAKAMVILVPCYAIGAATSGNGVPWLIALSAITAAFVLPMSFWLLLSSPVRMKLLNVARGVMEGFKRGA